MKSPPNQSSRGAVDAVVAAVAAGARKAGVVLRGLVAAVPSLLQGQSPAAHVVDGAAVVVAAVLLLDNTI